MSTSSRSKKNTPPTLENPYFPMPVFLKNHHSRQIHKTLSAWQKSKRVPPVILLTGARGSGKIHIAHHLAAALFCEKSVFAEQNDTLGFFSDTLPGGLSSPELPPCYNCPSCMKAKNRTWVDFNSVSDFKKGDTVSQSIKVEAFTAMRESMGRGPSDAPFRIFFIRDAENMTPAAANSLLKTLEEPPPNWLFFLTTQDPSLLLPTIVSRTNQIRINGFQEPDIQTILEKDYQIASEAAKRLSILSGGSPLNALKLFQNEKIKDVESIYDYLENAPSGLDSVIETALKSMDDLELFFNALESQYRSLSLSFLETKKTSRTFSGIEARITKRLVTNSKALSFILEQSEQVAMARLAATKPVNKKILLQSLLIPWI